MIPPLKKTVMTRRIADRFLRSISFPLYRVRVFCGSQDTRQMVSVLMRLRDGKVAFSGMPSVADLGIERKIDGVEVWSKDRDALKTLTAWFENHGYETSGIW